MTKYKIIKYQEKYFNEWNNFVENSNNGTIFHRLDFLNYHGEKFTENEHHLIILKGETIFGIIPLAIFEEDGKRIAKSPYGASYGGFVFKNAINYSSSRKIISTFIHYLKKINVNVCYITPAIGNYHQKECETFNFTLLENNFEIINSDITSYVNITNNDIYKNVITSRARNMISKAKKYDIIITEKVDSKAFWNLLCKTYTKFSKTPTHNLPELEFLLTKFQDKIYSYIAIFENNPISGILLFELNKKSSLVFYLVTDDDYIYTQSLSYLIYFTIQNLHEKGIEIFDFGTSSSNMTANPNLFQFKESFGTVGVYKNTYKANLQLNKSN